MALPRWTTSSVNSTEQMEEDLHGHSRKSNSWQALGVSDALSKALLQRGFKAPTPIQRRTIPLSLVDPPRDVLGMARTGSGKTLAYMIPLLQKLGMTRSSRGTRALILCPTRELAIQILKVGKDLARIKSKLKEKQIVPEILRWAVVIGGTALDDQFQAISESPDVIIATPGRFLHLAIEMSLDLRTVETIIFDEADRLFELGFAVQLQEIVHRLSPNRQNLLFSATLPSTVAQFARAHLANPTLVRLDADANLSPDLQLTFHYVKPEDKTAGLITLLNGILRETHSLVSPQYPQAIVFAATKHHVEYLSKLLSELDFRVSHIYGSLDQMARQHQLQSFRDGTSQVMVVTDVAARGLDIPVMDNVINYDFPSSPRIFIHRVGRTARAGRRGSALSLVTRGDLPYLVDLNDFLSLGLFISPSLGLTSLANPSLHDAQDSVQSILCHTGSDLMAMRNIMRKGQGMYERSRNKASANAYREAKLLSTRMTFLHEISPKGPASDPESSHEGASASRAELLHDLQNFSPHEAIFETRHGASRRTMSRRPLEDLSAKKRSTHLPRIDQVVETLARNTNGSGFSRKIFQDGDFFLPQQKSGLKRDAHYSVNDCESNSGMLSNSTLDLVGDEGAQLNAQRASQFKWDRARKRFKAGQHIGSDNQKMIRAESGVLLPSTLKSGRYDQWKKGNRTRSTPDPQSPNPRVKIMQSNRKVSQATAGLASVGEITKSRSIADQAKRKHKIRSRK